MIGELSRDRIDGQVIGILSGTDKPLGEFPDCIVAGHEHDAAPLENEDAVVL